MVGLSVFSSDGSRVGDVRAVNVGPDGNVAALHIRTGGVLGFGARVVAIPEGRFARSGQVCGSPSRPRRSQPAAGQGWPVGSGRLQTGLRAILCQSHPLARPCGRLWDG